MAITKVDERRIEVEHEPVRGFRVWRATVRDGRLTDMSMLINMDLSAIEASFLMAYISFLNQIIQAMEESSLTKE